jgi:D-alanine-D-alanine ligase
MRMKIAVIHQDVAAGAGRDEQDVLTQVDFVSRGLIALGHEPVAVPASLNLEAVAKKIADIKPAMAFNLVETLAGKGRLIHLVPSLLDALMIPYTGAGAEAMFLTSNKLLAKRWLAAAGLPTPPWFTAAELRGARPADAHGATREAAPQDLRGKMYEAIRGEFRIEGAWLVKSVWEHASIGLDEDSVLFGADRKRLLAEVDARKEALGGACLAEAYIDGREFNLSLLAGRQGPADGRTALAARDTRSPLGEANRPEVLPPAEIRFDAYPPGKVRVVGYRSKWEEGTFEYANTPRAFEFPDRDAPLLAQLKEMALRCWKLFDLKGYARVDFRVDREGRPWILEVNANPCLSPDAGFAAAALQAGLTYPEALGRIIGGQLPYFPHGALSPYSDTVIPAKAGIRNRAGMPDQSLPGLDPGSGMTKSDMFENRGAVPLFREEVRPEDRQAVGRLVRATGFFSEEEADIAEELVEERLARGNASGYFFLFAEEGNRLLGYACFGPIPGSVHSFDLYWIAVDPAEQGRGIGRALMAAAERIMAGFGARLIYADTSSRPRYGPTRAFYLSCGYREEALLADFYAPGDGKVIFSKEVINY